MIEELAEENMETIEKYEKAMENMEFSVALTDVMAVDYPNK